MALSVTSGAFAADKLTFYCSAQEDWCQLMTKEFSAATGIKVNMTRKSSGETFAQIKPEKQLGCKQVFGRARCRVARKSIWLGQRQKGQRKMWSQCQKVQIKEL